MNQYENWIDEENLGPVLIALGWICDHKFTEDDWAAVKLGIQGVDEDKDIWFHYTLTGRFKIEIQISMMVGSSNYSLRIDSAEEIAPQVTPIVGLAQCYRISEF